MNRWVAWVSVTALFVSGVFIGALGFQLFQNAERTRHRGPFPPAERFIHKMEERLDLSAEQLRSIEEILQRTRSESSAIRAELRPRLEALGDRTRSEIEAVLDAEQREALEALRRQFGRKADRFFLDGGPGEPGFRNRRQGPRRRGAGRPLE